MAALSNICRINLLCSSLSKKVKIPNRSIATSGKKKDSKETCPPETIYRKVPDFSKPLENKNWVSYGFDNESESKDRFHMHIYGFSVFTLLFCGFAFLHTYEPDKKRVDWARREAFIVLHEREQLGLEPIDPNYVDPSKVVLPPDEELSDEDIII